VPAKDSAAYMRDYRANHRQVPAPRRCNHCGIEYTPARADSRYCSASCKGYGYRARYTITHEFSPEGWAYADNDGGRAVFGSHHLCLVGLRGPDTGCRNLATVAVTRRQHFRGHSTTGLYCAEHAPSRYDYCTF
jgi:hypothetical protein